MSFGGARAASPLKLLAEFLFLARSQVGIISIPDDLCARVRTSRPTGELFNAADVEAIVSAIDVEHDPPYLRLHRFSLAILCSVFTYAEQCLAKHRGLFLVATSMHLTNTDTESDRQQKLLHKVELGSALSPLIRGLNQTKNRHDTRRWMGLLAQVLLQDCPVNSKRLSREAKEMRDLGDVMKHGTCEVVRIMAGSIIRQLLFHEIEPNVFWPEGLKGSDDTARAFPRGRYQDTQWITSFEHYVEDMASASLLTQARSSLFFAHTAILNSTQFTVLDQSAILVSISDALNIVIQSSAAEITCHVDVPFESIQRIKYLSPEISLSKTPNFCLILLLCEGRPYYVNAAAQHGEIKLMFRSETSAKYLRDLLSPDEASDGDGERDADSRHGAASSSSHGSASKSAATVQLLPQEADMSDLMRTAVQVSSMLRNVSVLPTMTLSNILAASNAPGKDEVVNGAGPFERVEQRDRTATVSGNSTVDDHSESEVNADPRRPAATQEAPSKVRSTSKGVQRRIVSSTKVSGIGGVISEGMESTVAPGTKADEKNMEAKSMKAKSPNKLRGPSQFSIPKSSQQIDGVKQYNPNTTIEGANSPVETFLGYKTSNVLPRRMPSRSEIKTVTQRSKKARSGKAVQAGGVTYGKKSGKGGGRMQNVYDLPGSSQLRPVQTTQMGDPTLEDAAGSKAHGPMTQKSQARQRQEISRKPCAETSATKDLPPQRPRRAAALKAVQRMQGADLSPVPLNCTAIPIGSKQGTDTVTNRPCARRETPVQGAPSEREADDETPIHGSLMPPQQMGIAETQGANDSHDPEMTAAPERIRHGEHLHEGRSQRHPAHSHPAISDLEVNSLRGQQIVQYTSTSHAESPRDEHHENKDSPSKAAVRGGNRPYTNFSLSQPLSGPLTKNINAQALLNRSAGKSSGLGARKNADQPKDKGLKRRVGKDVSNVRYSESKIRAPIATNGNLRQQQAQTAPLLGESELDTVSMHALATTNVEQHVNHQTCNKTRKGSRNLTVGPGRDPFARKLSAFANKEATKETIGKPATSDEPMIPGIPIDQKRTTAMVTHVAPAGAKAMSGVPKKRKIDQEHTETVKKARLLPKETAEVTLKAARTPMQAFRKTEIISFGNSGPRNQGTVSRSKRQSTNIKAPTKLMEATTTNVRQSMPSAKAASRLATKRTESPMHSFPDTKVRRVASDLRNIRTAASLDLANAYSEHPDNEYLDPVASTPERTNHASYHLTHPVHRESLGSEDSPVLLASTRTDAKSGGAEIIDPAGLAFPRLPIESIPKPNSQTTRVNERGSPMPLRHDMNTRSFSRCSSSPSQDDVQAIDEDFTLAATTDDLTMVTAQGNTVSSVPEYDTLSHPKPHRNKKLLPSSPHAPSEASALPMHEVSAKGDILNMRTDERIMPTNPQDPFLENPAPSLSFTRCLRSSFEALASQSLGVTDDKLTFRRSRRSLADPLTGHDREKTMVDAPKPVTPRVRHRPLGVSMIPDTSEDGSDFAALSPGGPMEDARRAAEKWRNSLKPHQKDILDGLSNISEHFVKQMIRSEHAIAKIVNNYVEGGYTLIEHLRDDCQTKLKAQSAALGKTERTIRESHEKTIASLKHDYKIIKGSTQKLEDQWNIRQRELQVAAQAAIAANVFLNA